MPDRMIGMVNNLGMTIGAHVGTEIQDQVMENSEVIQKGTKKEVLGWFVCAMEKLDHIVDRNKRIEIMRECGHNCAEVNKKQLKHLISKRSKYGTLKEFIGAEIEKPSKIMRIEREGDKLIQYFSPRRHGSGIRCFCSPWRDLPDEKNISDTWCHCSQGFVEKLWEGYVGKPVKITLLESALQGAEECKFEIISRDLTL